MKNELCIILLLSLFISGCNKITRNKSKDNAIVMFDSQNYDFGNIKMHKIISHTFYYKNIGQCAFYINDIKTSCGCTIPHWTKEPVKPNSKGSIKIDFINPSYGEFHKCAMIICNVNGRHLYLILKGKITK
jgi:hypothetical protein